MNRSLFTTLAASLALPFLLVACADTTGDVTGIDTDGSMSSVMELPDDLLTADDLAAALNAEGLLASVTDQHYSQPFFAASGREVTVNGEVLQVFEYADEDSAEADADQISDDGTTVGTTQVTWVGSPHFYQDGNLLVLYLGDDEALLEQLEDVLNGQFAGAEWDDGMTGTGAGL